MAAIWTMGEILVEVMRPRAGMPLDRAGEFLGPYPSGAPAIFIDTAARLGQKAGIIGGVGADDFGHFVLTRLELDGVDCHLVRRYDGEATAVAFVPSFHDGSRKFLYHIDRTPAVMVDFFPEGIIREDGFFHVMGCSLMANEHFRLEIIKAMEWFADGGASISFDPNIRVELLRGRSLEQVIGPVLERCTVLMPGEAELALLSGVEDIVRGVSIIFQRYPIELIVLKRGKRGCDVWQRGMDPIHVPAYPIVEVDPTGAGDCFDAGFLCGLLNGMPLVECAKIASAAGALNAKAFGPMEGDISPEAVEKMTAGEKT